MSDYGAMAEVLGLRDYERLTPVDFVDQVEAGLPHGSLERLTRAMSPDDPAFRFRVVPRATLSRRKGGSLSRQASERIARLAQVWTEAVDVWGGETAARAFLDRPHAMLDDKTPLTLVLESEMGAALVRDVLGRLRYGSAA